MSSVHTLYVEETRQGEVRETFANLMNVQPGEVPDTLLKMWEDAQHMANRLQPGEMEVRNMVMLILIDRFVSANKTEKDVQQTAKNAVKQVTSTSARKYE